MRGEGLVLYRSAEEISKAIAGLADRLVADDRVADFTALVLLDGARRFFDALAMQLEVRHGARFKAVSMCRVKSYKGCHSSGSLSGLEVLTEEDVGDRVLIIDDILDTGLTLDLVSRTVREAWSVRHGASGGEPEVCSCVLFVKDTAGASSPEGPVRRECTYYGMEVGDCFVVGYGLDHDGRYRDLDALYVLDV